MNRARSKLAGLAWIAAAIALAVVVAAGLPTLARHVPWAAERWLAGVVGGGPAPGERCGATDPEAARLLQQLVTRIYPLDAGDAALPITVHVIRGDTVNAFATLGGQIYVFDGLLKQAQSPQELAGVLSHEIEHVRNRHVLQGAVVRMLTLGALHGQDGGAAAYGLLTLSFSRRQEAEADEKGLERLRAAHVDASGFRDFFLRAGKTASPFQILSSHPDDGSRAELANRFRSYPATPIMGQAGWDRMKTICR